MPEPMRRLVPVLITCCCASLSAADLDFKLDGLRIESPGASLGLDGVVAVKGVVARLDGNLLIADHMRFNPADDDLWVSGDVVLRLPTARIATARLGAHPTKGTGEAWDAEVTLQLPHDKQAVVRAARVEISRSELILHDVDVGLGHGGIFGFSTARLRVLLRDPPDPTRSAPANHVRGIEMIRPTGTVVGVPVFWLPYAYRDFVLNYPWSRVVVGKSSRLGTFVRYWVGSDLPEMAQWKTGLGARADLHSIAGGGGGGWAHWYHPTWGRGDANYYHQPAEKLRSQNDAGVEIQTRPNDFWDVAHYTPLHGPGTGLFAGRFVAAPPPDPAEPGALSDGNALRWMSDYMPEELSGRPYPTRSLAVAYGVPGGTIVVDTTRRHSDEIDTTERWFGLQAVSSPWQLIGPFHLGGDAWAEDLHRIQHDTSAQRLTGKAYLAGSQWWNGIGADGEGGMRLLSYDEGVINGVEQDGFQAAYQGYGDAGVSARMVNQYSNWRHQIIPRVGVQILGKGLGDELPSYGFADPRDQFATDERYWTAGLTTQGDGGRPMFRAGVLTRWAMREKERQYVDNQGVQQLSSSDLVDVQVTADGHPTEDLLLTCQAIYDNRPQEWTRVNAGATWNPVRWNETRWGETYIPKTSTSAKVEQHQPGIGLIASRYRLDCDLVLTAGGAPVDTWRFRLGRTMVDGAFTIGYDFVRNPDGAVDDRRILINFQLAGVGTTLPGNNGWVYSQR